MLVASSTPQSAAQWDQSWLQQADINVADAFLNQLDDTPAKNTDTPVQQMEKPTKTSKKRKAKQPWFMLPKQKHQCLDVLELSSDHSSDEPLGESSATSSSESDSTVKHSRKHKHSKKHNLKSGMFAKHASTIKKLQLWPQNHLNSHFFLKCPNSRIFPGISSWLVRLLAGQVLHSSNGVAAPFKTVGLLETSLWKPLQGVSAIYGCCKDH